jgi:CheY-like chemotaxis protein
MTYQLDQIKVLIVDDMAPMLSLTSSTLQNFGFKQILTAQNGEEAFKLFCQHDPDLVITDWIMEPVDGLELTKMIRTHPTSPNKFTPIIMMTGFTAKARVELSRDSGITEFLVKPFTAIDLYKRIVQAIEKPRQFVDFDKYFGPDRRRRMGDDYQGPRRRDKDDKDTSNNEDSGALILQKLKEDAQNL